MPDGALNQSKNGKSYSFHTPLQMNTWCRVEAEIRFWNLKRSFINKSVLNFYAIPGDFKIQILIRQKEAAFRSTLEPRFRWIDDKRKTPKL